MGGAGQQQQGFGGGGPAVSGQPSMGGPMAGGGNFTGTPAFNNGMPIGDMGTPGPNGPMYQRNPWGLPGGSVPTPYSGTPATGGPVSGPPGGGFAPLGGGSYNPGIGQLPPTQGQPAQQIGGGVGPGLQNAQNQLQNTISGNMLNPQTNHYLQSYYNAAAQPLTQQFQQVTDPSILGNAVKSGNLFSSAPQQNEFNAQQALAQGLGNLGANIYEPAYQQERQLQQQAIGMEPGIAQAQYLPAQELMNIGNQQQQLQQSIQNYPLQLLSGMAGLIGPGTGGSGVNIGTSQIPGSMK